MERCFRSGRDVNELLLKGALFAYMVACHCLQSSYCMWLSSDHSQSHLDRQLLFRMIRCSVLGPSTAKPCPSLGTACKDVSSPLHSIAYWHMREMRTETVREILLFQRCHARSHEWIRYHDSLPRKLYTECGNVPYLLIILLPGKNGVCFPQMTTNPCRRISAVTRSIVGTRLLYSIVAVQGRPAERFAPVPGF